MKICHVCNAECEDFAELCPICGADISGYTEEAEITEEANEAEEIILNNPTLLATVDDVVSSEILKDILHENGIPFTCDNEDEGALKVTFGGSFIADDIYVDESDFERANEIYEEFLNSEHEFDEEFFDEESEETENI